MRFRSVPSFVFLRWTLSNDAHVERGMAGMMRSVGAERAPQSRSMMPPIQADVGGVEWRARLSARLLPYTDLQISPMPSCLVETRC